MVAWLTSSSSSSEEYSRSLRKTGPTLYEYGEDFLWIIYRCKWMILLLVTLGASITGIAMLGVKMRQCQAVYDIDCQQKAFLATYPHTCTCTVWRWNTTSPRVYEHTVDFTMNCPSPKPVEFTFVSKRLPELATHPEILTTANQATCEAGCPRECYTNLRKSDWEDVIFFTTPIQFPNTPFHYFDACRCADGPYVVGIVLFSLVVLVLLCVLGVTWENGDIWD